MVGDFIQNEKGLLFKRPLYFTSTVLYIDVYNTRL